MTVAGILIFNHIMEIICYAIIYLEVRKSNKEVSGLLSASAVRRRTKQNILTFMNQVAIFGVEISGYILVCVTIIFPSGRPLAILYTCLNPILPLAIVFASNPLREAALKLFKIG